MVGLEQTLVALLPPGVAALVFGAYIGLKAWKRRDESQSTVWGRMQQQLENLHDEVTRLRSRAEAAERERDAYRARFGPLDHDQPTSKTFREDRR